MYPTKDTCSPPPLPRPRTDGVTFLTAGPSPSIATCAGKADSPDGGLILGDCLVLDVENQVWKAGVIGQVLTSENTHLAAVTMPVGVYLIGGTKAPQKTEVLLAGTTHWQKGPQIPTYASMRIPCAVVISDRSFLAIYEKNIIEFDTSAAGPTSNAGWKDSSTYPRLQTSRTAWPGCAKLGSKVIISGGGYRDDGRWRSHKSTEILDLTTKSLSVGGDMEEPRRHFHILNFDNKLLAIGGVDNSGFVSGNPASISVEEWDPSTSTWSKSSTGLEEERASFGALVVSEDLVCPP